MRPIMANDAPPVGLTAAEAARRLAADGPNELPAQRRRSDLHLFLEVLREPMLALLVAGATVYALIGDPLDAVALAVAAGLVIVLTFVQARRAERALYALRELTSPQATVIRDGERRRIDGRAVVRGDVLLVEEGDRIAADGIVRESEALLADESLLTGESLPVAKAAADLATGTATAQVYAGSLVVTGRAVVEVTATGARSELGRIGASLRDIEQTPSAMQVEIRNAVRWFGGVGFALCALLLLIYAFARGDWMTGLLAGIALGMAVIPEEFPVVSTVLLALGGHRLARQNVLTRHLTAIETLGSVTVLCVDKTGTLTENRMRVERLVTAEADVRPEAADSAAARMLLEVAAAASNPAGSDPMDRAILAIAPQGTVPGDLGPAILTPMARGRWYRGADGAWTACVKGAPETVLAASRATAAQRERWLAVAAAHAGAGRRLLAVARSAAADVGPAAAGGVAMARASALPGELEVLGLVVLSDPVRAAVPAALSECREAGIRVMLITGDHPATARRIAAEVGLPADGELLTGDELDALGDAELDARLSRLAICARVRPEHKLRLVRRLEAAGERVGMTGDGVNDAPALRAALAGVALGGRGTDVAREAADIVLTDDRFETLVKGVREGRRIFSNLQHAVNYIAAIHVPTAGVTLLAAVAGLPPLLLPIHIACLELLIDPACTLVFEAENPPADLMRRPPRRSRLFDAPLVLTGLAQGLIVLMIVLGIVGLGVSLAVAEDQLRSLTFSSIVLSNTGLLLANRSRRRGLLETLAIPNPALWIIGAAGMLLAYLATAVPPLARIFHMAPLPPWAWVALLVAVVVTTLVLQSVHGLARRREESAPA